MSKPIEALRNKSDNIFWPATASDAVIHPKTKKTLTEHITRYDLTEYDTVTSLETGIQKLIGDKSNGGLEVIPKEGDRILVGNWDKGDPKTRLPGATEYIYFSEGELDEPGDNYYEYSRCWTEICYDTSDIPRLSSEGRLFSENSPIMILSDIDVSETYLNDPYLIRANLGKYCHLVSPTALNSEMDSISKVINSGGDYVYYKIEKPDTKTIYYSISNDKFYRFIPRSGKTGGMEEIGPKEITGVSINGVTVTPDLTGVINLGTIGENLQEITWSALKTLRDGGNLEPGKFYRITDYTCTTTQTNTQSAGHVFDIIVFALSGSTLSETAWADHHEGDTYFSNCKLEAWELKYCLDNDTDRFAWADTVIGKGVIFYMKDEWNNECPYDFKNIQFKRKLSDGVLDTTNGDDTFVYTFNLWRVNTSNIEDASIIGNTLENDEGHISGVYGNKINPVSEYNVYSEQTSFEVTQYLLNDNVFLNSDDEEGFFYGCYTNILEYDCSSNTFGSNAYGNTFGDDCKNNTFGNNYFSNTFGNDCYDNILGTGCNSNIFGNSCQQNVFGDSCACNISGNVCTRITLGTGCNSNIFGNYCTNITALKNNNNSYNIFENNIANISLLENNPVTTINNCTIEQNCRSIIFGASSFKNGTVESGNSYINLIRGISGNGSIQNFRICSGIAGTSSLYKNIIFNIVDNSYLITYKPANSVEISI